MTLTRKARWMVLAGLVLVLVFAGVGARLVQVHSQGQEWRLTPSAAPPLIQLDDRSYRRGDAREVPAEVFDTLPGGLTERGTTPGGGTIYARPAGEHAQTVAFVRDGSELVTYALTGGP